MYSLLHGMKVDRREIGWKRVEWIYLAQDRDPWQAPVNTLMKLWVLAPRSLLVTGHCVTFALTFRNCIRRPFRTFHSIPKMYGHTLVKHKKMLSFVDTTNRHVCITYL
jgi:hypothetical protein